MRTGLKIFPAVSPTADYALDLLELDTDTALLTIISETADEFGVDDSLNGIKGYTLNLGFQPIHVDALGENINYVLSQHLREALKRYISGSWRNNSIVNYLMNIPKNYRIYLYWQ